MGYTQENGYVPNTVETILQDFMAKINIQFGTTYTWETFQATNYYKYFYAIAQKYAENETKTSEIFAKLTQYFAILNDRISRPVVTNPGIIEKLAREGWIASVKPMIEADAGKVNICVDVDDTDPDYEDFKLEINTLLSQITVGGAVTQGTEESAIVISNGQSFDYKYHLPDRKIVKLRLTITLSENNQVVVGDPDAVKEALLDNITARYRLGKNFEPQRYFSIEDAPWAESVLLEWSDDWDPGPATWNDTVFDSEFDEIFDVRLENITLIEA